VKFKNIHIGSLINQVVTERGIEMSRICNFLECSEQEIQNMYDQANSDTTLLLKWSKLLEYDFFRIYSHHLLLYTPFSAINADRKTKNTALPKFRKNIYTKEITDHILEQIEAGEMTKSQVIEQYKIPKTTLYKWISKYKK